MSDEIKARVTKGLARPIADLLGRKELTLSRYCESPIELELGLALCALMDIEGGSSGAPWFRSGLEVTPEALIEIHARDQSHLLVPQASILGYRMDFLMLFHLGGGQYWRACIECDGHAFHEKTKAQVSRDKARDRAIAAEGVTIFRFSGSEIYRGSVACAAEILAAAESALFRHREERP